MLFNLFKDDKRIVAGRGRKRKLTVREVVDHLNRFELTTAGCTLIRDHLGNEKVEDYGQVDVFRVRDEEIFMYENGFCITTPTGMKIRDGVGHGRLAGIISAAETVHEGEGPSLVTDAVEDEEEGEDGVGSGGAGEGDGAEEAEEDLGPDEEAALLGSSRRPRAAAQDAFSEAESDRRGPEEDDSDAILGIGQAVRLRFFHRRIPYEIDCQIMNRFNPGRFREADLTPRFGVGYHVRPLNDVRKRDKRRHIRYTHRLGFGHLRMRNEVQFYVYAHRTDFEVPDKGALASTLTVEDFRVTPFGSREVPEVQGAEKLEDIVEFFMGCMVNNPAEKRFVYASKPYLDRLNKSTLVGLSRFNVVGAQQTTILPKIFVKKPVKGKGMVDRQLAARVGGGTLDARKLRLVEDIHTRYQLMTREHKLFQLRRWRKSLAGNVENDRALVGFSSAYGLSQGDVYSMRHLIMPCEVTDIGVENITLKPVPYNDVNAEDPDRREFVRQEDGFQVELLNFSVGGAQIRGGETQEVTEAFLKYLVGDNYETMNFVERVEALQKYAVLLHFYPVLNFVRHEIQDYEPFNLPFKIPVIARVARFRTSQSKEDDEPRISSLGMEYIYNPDLYGFSRDIYEYDRWEQITAYTENTHFLDVHKSLQLLFGFDRALEEMMRDGGEKPSDKEEEKESASN